MPMQDAEPTPASRERGNVFGLPHTSIIRPGKPAAAPVPPPAVPARVSGVSAPEPLRPVAPAPRGSRSVRLALALLLAGLAAWAYRRGARPEREAKVGDPLAQASACDALYALNDPARAGEVEAACLAALDSDRRSTSPLAADEAYRVRAILAYIYKDWLQKPREAADLYTALLLSPGIAATEQCEVLLGRAETRGRLGDALGAAQDLTRAAGVCPDPSDVEYARRAAALYAAQQEGTL